MTNFTEKELEDIERYREDHPAFEFVSDSETFDRFCCEERERKEREDKERQEQEEALVRARAEEERLALLSKEDREIENHLLALKEIFESRKDKEKLELLQKLKKRDCDKNNFSSENKNSFPVMKTVKLGLHKNADEYRRAFKGFGCSISEWADSILGRIIFSSVVEDVDLVIRSVAELGFANGATLAQIYESAGKLGLLLCPAEVGPALCEQYHDQPMNEWLMIAMEPITDSDGNLDVFRVARDGDSPWLDSLYGSPEYVWSAGIRFVFVSGK